MSTRLSAPVSSRAVVVAAEYPGCACAVTPARATPGAAHRSAKGAAAARTASLEPRLAIAR